jgi:ribosomal-protein-alanine N-acetyltransferase
MEAARRGARRIYLEVAEDNAAARALYAAEGFEPIGRRRGYYARREGPAVDAITMRREVRRGWRAILRP